MKTYKVEVKDSEPQVGIFIILDGKPEIYSRPVDLMKAQRNGVDDAGEIFHKQLLDYYIKKASDYEKARYKEAKIQDPEEEFLYYPRGRVTYNYASDMYFVYIPPIMAKDLSLIKKVIREFNLPINKFKVYGDYTYEPYELHNEPVKKQ